MSHILGTHHSDLWQLFPHDRSNTFFLSEGEVDGGEDRDDGNCVDALLQCLRFNVGSITNNGCTKGTCLFADLVTSRLNLGGVDTRDFASVNLQSARNEKTGAFQDWPEGSDDRQMRRILKEDTLCFRSGGKPTNGGVPRVKAPQRRMTATRSSRSRFKC